MIVGLMRNWGAVCPHFKVCNMEETLSISLETYMWDRKQQLELDMEQLIGSKLGKAVYCPPAYLTYMQNTPCERLDWRNPKAELRLSEEISTTSDMQMIPR